MDSKFVFGLWPFLLLNASPALAAQGCRVVLTAIGAHQTLRSEDAPNPLVTRDEMAHGEPLSISDFQEGTLSANGKYALIMTGGKFSVWDVREKRILANKVPNDPAREPVITADGANVIGVTRAGLTVWDSATGNIVAQPNVAELGRLHRVSPDGKLVLMVKTKADTGPKPAADPKLDLIAKLFQQTSYEQAELTLVDPKTGQVVRRLKDHQSALRESYFSPDGKFIATTSQDGLVRVEDTATGEVKASFGFGKKADTVEFSPDGKSVFVVPRGKPPVFVPLDGTNKPVPLGDKWGEVYDGAFSPASANLMALNTSKGFQIVDRAKGKLDIGISIPQEQGGQIRFSSDGKYFLLGFDGGRRFVVCDVAAGRPLYELKGSPDGGTGRMDYSESGGVIGVSFYMDALRLWETQKFPAPPSSDATSFTTADGQFRFLRKVDDDGTVRIKLKAQ